jgi:hypothetical protein
MKNILLVTAVLLGAVSAQAVLDTTNWTVNSTVPDNNYRSWVNSQSVSE